MRQECLGEDLLNSLPTLRNVSSGAAFTAMQKGCTCPVISTLTMSYAQHDFVHAHVQCAKTSVLFDNTFCFPPVDVTLLPATSSAPHTTRDIHKIFLSLQSQTLCLFTADKSFQRQHLTFTASNCRFLLYKRLQRRPPEAPQCRFAQRR